MRWTGNQKVKEQAEEKVDRLTQSGFPDTRDWQPRGIGKWKIGIVEAV